MRFSRKILFAAVYASVAALLCAVPLRAEEGTSGDRHLVTIFPFLPAEGKATPMERTVSDMIAARLDVDPAMYLLSRERLSALAGEAGVDLGGRISEEEALRVSRLAEAHLMVVGRTRRVEREMVVIAKVVGVQNAQSEEVFVSGSTVGRIRPLITELADGISRTIAEAGRDILSGVSGTETAISSLKEKTAQMELPTVYLQVREDYSGETRDSPATQEEILRFLRAGGIPLAPEKSAAEVVIFGRAKGMPASSSGALVTSDVEIELRAVSPVRGELLAVVSTSHSAVDIFASSSANKAFREATAAMAPDFLLTLLEAWNGEQSPPR